MTAWILDGMPWLGEDVGIGQQSTGLILGCQQRCAIQRPVNADRRVVPQEATFEFRRPVVGRLVQEFRAVAEYHEAVGKAFRNPYLAFVGGRQVDANPVAEGWRAFAQVDGDIEYFAGSDAHQLALRLLDLIVQAAQHALGRLGVVVLYEVAGDAGQFAKVSLIKTFIEKASIIAKYGGLENQYVWNCCGRDLHGISVSFELGGMRRAPQSILSSSKRNRY